MTATLRSFPPPSPISHGLTWFGTSCNAHGVRQPPLHSRGKWTGRRRQMRGPPTMCLCKPTLAKIQSRSLPINCDWFLAESFWWKCSNDTSFYCCMMIRITFPTMNRKWRNLTLKSPKKANSIKDFSYHHNAFGTDASEACEWVANIATNHWHVTSMVGGGYFFSHGRERVSFGGATASVDDSWLLHRKWDTYTHFFCLFCKL